MITSNRAGKTDWMTGDLALFAMGRHPSVKTPRNSISWITVLTNDKVHEVMYPKFKQKLGPVGVKWEYNDNKSTFYVKCGMQNWSEIVIKSQEAGIGSFESSTVHRLAFDEQPYQDIFNAALIRVIDTGGQVLIAATMWEEGISWLYDEFIVPVLENKPEAKNIELVGPGLTMWDNPILDKEWIDEAYRKAAQRNPEEARVRFFGEYIPLSGKCPFSMRSLNYYRKTAEPGMECELLYGSN